MSAKIGINIGRVFIYILLAFLTFLCVAPLWILVVNSTRSTAEINLGISLIPSTNLAFNWRVLDQGGSVDLFRSFGNSAFISSLTTVLTVYFGLLCAYAIEIYDFKLKKITLGLVLFLIMIPGQVAIIGFYQLVVSFNMLNSYIPLILPAIGGAGAVFFFKQYLESCVIMELIHAARIDGCSELGIFHKIMMPIAAPGAFTMAIFAFVGSWNNFFTPFLIITDQKKSTLPMAIQIIINGNTYNRELGAFYLGLAITIVPVIVVYIALSKYIISGIAMGALKE
ncbi:MAG: carbohydrate ABC transporter permease [Oscillospiraceae bacterium]|nr:carbohydrate ABC transporter permease [Oscillospiraceae bacterium]